MKWTNRIGAALLATGIGAALTMTAVSAAGTINGAGSTAINPVLSIWAQNYNVKTGIQINYQSIGSGGGIKQIEAKTVDFGASDKPLMHADLVKNSLVQFPQVFISIVPIVHLPGIKAGQIVLDGKVLADIYLGKVTKWNDPVIKSLNPHVPLPNMAIITVHRADGSGTTFNFTDYLSKMSPEWKANVGSDTSVSWPNGVGGKGNSGVAASVAQTVGAIGYVEYAYAMQSNLVYTDMINAAGVHVKPTMESFTAAASNADFSKVQDFYLVITNQPGAGSWPIMGTTWVIMRTDYPVDRNKTILQFCDYAFRSGDADARKLDYVPIPDNVVKVIEASWPATLHTSP